MNLKKIINSDSRFAEIVRFGIVGGIATILQFGIYVIFVEVIHVKAVPSTIISYALSFIVNFFLSSYFTFHTRPNAKKGLGFTLSHLVNMGLQTGFVAIFQQVVGKTLALLPALAICIPVNYLLVRFAFTSKIFSGKKSSDQENTDGSTLLQDEETLLENDEILKEN